MEPEPTQHPARPATTSATVPDLAHAESVPVAEPRHALVESALGNVTIVAIEDSLTGLYFDEHTRRPPADSFGQRVDLAADPTLAAAARQLHEYLAGTRTQFELPFAPEGDEFHQAVWAIVARIPFGGTITYGAIATELGNPALAQRVGQAVGANPLCVFIPCHRVVGSTGKLTGYAGGIERKHTLLTIEEPAPEVAGRLF